MKPEPQPVGVWGELWLGGVQVARGYINRPEKTAEAFVANHPWPETDPSGRGVVYRTGDRVRWYADGELEFGGRIDFQVKLRGQRIELGEIEHALRSQPGVVEAIVLLSKELDALVAYVSPLAVFKGIPPQKSGFTDALHLTDLNALQGVRDALPEYMVPSLVIGVDEWPRTSSGKIDRKRLPAPDGFAAGKTEVVAPRSAAEAAVYDAFAAALGLDAETISVEASFFELGGNSLRAVVLAQRLTSALGHTVSAAEVLQRPTVAALASTHDAHDDCDTNDTHTVVTSTVDASALLSSAHPVSWNQSQLLTVHLVGATAAYNIPMAHWLVGPLDVEALRQALGAVIERHAILRTTYEHGADGSDFVQRVLPRLDEARLLRELTVSSDEEAEAAIVEAWSSGFELFGETGSVLRTMLVRVGSAERHLLLINVHHVAFDGMSAGILLAELGALYRGGTAADVGLAELPVQYVDFAIWQRDGALVPLLEASRDHWRAHLVEGALPLLELPLDLPRPAMQTFRGATVPVTLSAEVGAQLTALCQQHGCTLFQLILGVWALLLCRHAGQDEVVIGSPYHGRDAAGTEVLIGYFVNILALRVEAPRGGSVAALLRLTRDAASAGMRHAALPFQQIVHELLPRRTFEPSRSSVFQAMLAWQDLLALETGLKLGGAVEAQPMASVGELPSGVAKVELTLEAASTAEGSIEGSAEFNTDLYARESIERLAARLPVLAAALAEADTEADVWALALMPPDEAERVLWTFNDTAAAFRTDLCIHDLVAAQAARTPDAVALEWQKGTIAYADMMESASRVAAWLDEHGTTPDSRVALQLHRSLEQVVGMISVLLSGGAYLPLDLEWPIERRRFIMEDANCNQLVAQSMHMIEFGWFFQATLRLDHVSYIPDCGDLFRHAVKRMEASNTLAYVIFTSGSTGKPKGVSVPHTGVVNLVRGAKSRDYPGEVRYVVSFNYVFDPCTFGLFVTLGSLAGTCVLANPKTITSTLEEVTELTCLNHVPSLMSVLTIPSSVRWIEVGGEAITEAVIRNVSEATVLYNAYGPTEVSIASVGKVVDRIPAHWRPSSIGRPLPNVTCVIVNPNYGPTEVTIRSHGKRV